MTPERHQQIKRLFLAAVELTPAQAAVFLDAACGADHDLRTQVESLLATHDPETLLPHDDETPASEGATRVLHSQRSSPGNAHQNADEPVVTRETGSIIAGRYRIVGPLGQGGIGVVYRAEDLELNETVALKFLHPHWQRLDSAMELLRHEVRVARQVSHPSVVRVYDLGVAEGEVFVSMEYVDGEDLASLVRRVGRLPAEKLLQVARQLAEGLAAAHDSGVLHRDLKPTNMMIDGNGNVKILDFGIAAAIHEVDAVNISGGTPGFLAPELLRGQAPSVQSDLYAWGLVVDYAASGRLPSDIVNDGSSSADEDLAADFWESAGIEPELASSVRDCLNSDPASRPRSADELVVRLAAGDPLAAAVRAGRVPTPGLLVASSSWQPSGRLLDGLLAGGLLLLIFLTLLADRTLFLSRCGLARPPEVLQEIAKETLIQLGYAADPSLVRTGVTFDANCLEFMRGHPQISAPWDDIRTARFPAVFFWYRQGDPRLPRPAPLGDPAWERLAQPIPGTATVRLDGQGRLLSLQVAAVAPDSSHAPREPVDWHLLFELAGLRVQDFRAVRATRLPPLFADGLYAWEGPHPANPQLALQVSAATLQGRLVFFDVDQPWEQPRPFDAMFAFAGRTPWVVTVRTATWLLLILVSIVLAAQNIRLGHADGAGALRLVAGVVILATIDWLLGTPHTFLAAEELAIGFLWLNVIAFAGAVAGIAYVAVEPFVRRRWPWSIITTRRLLAGQLADRGIWADILLGLVVGLAVIVILQTAALVGNRFVAAVGGLNQYGLGLDLLDCFGLRYKAAVLINALLYAVIEALLLLSFVVAIRRLTGSMPATLLIFVSALTAIVLLARGDTSPVDALLQAVVWTIAAVLLVRPGLLATIAAMLTVFTVNSTPITTNYAAWYAPTSFFVQGMLVVGLVGSWWFARPPHVSRPILSRAGNSSRKMAV